MTGHNSKADLPADEKTRSTRALRKRKAPTTTEPAPARNIRKTPRVSNTEAPTASNEGSNRVRTRASGVPGDYHAIDGPSSTTPRPRCRRNRTSVSTTRRTRSQPSVVDRLSVERPTTFHQQRIHGIPQRGNCTAGSGCHETRTDCETGYERFSKLSDLK